LIGDPLQTHNSHQTNAPVRNANLPPTTPKYYTSGGRLGFKRDPFVQAGGVQILMQMFREKSFVGQEVSMSNDACNLSEQILATQLASCFNKALASLRKLVYAIPLLVEEQVILDHGAFLPFLFTLLASASCFKCAVALIKEILSVLSQLSLSQPQLVEDVTHVGCRPSGQPNLDTTFFWETFQACTSSGKNSTVNNLHIFVVLWRCSYSNLKIVN
jgi:hypothetical protein